MKIQKLQAREILDSRGNPTIAVRAVAENGFNAEAMVPSGASTGVHEAHELRDGDKNRYGGTGVLTACKNVEELIFSAVKDLDIMNQRAIDEAMILLDGTENKSKLGANAILAVSLAVARLAAQVQGVELYESIRRGFRFSASEYRLPYPMMNIINGGVHADSGLDIQEFMIVPQQQQLSERVRAGAEIFHALKDILKKQKQVVSVGDEGGFAPHLRSNEAALEAIVEAVTQAGYTLGQDVCIAFDAAASEFFRDGQYAFDGKMLTAQELIAVYDAWIEKYAIISIEDGLAEDDWDGWQMLTKQLGGRIRLVGDDLFVTNVKRLQQGIDRGVANAILIKVNQIGTLTETIDAIQLAQQYKYTVIISHRSGETEDTTIADLAVAVNAEYIKTGSLSRSERVAKYNRLMAIEHYVA
ncbi:MAG: phosphopyruvate hydratase [Candidatus Kerfeldbacteria bacterium]|nr:phosphopyruvate hydratase [Candidatus Kerfeldbacteria bacterium]